MTVTRRRFTLGVFCLLIAASTALSGCAYKERIKRDHDGLAKELAEIESMGAKICAPMEYAGAEARLDFAMDEWAERDYGKAWQHLDVAREDLSKARNLSRNCIETTPPDTDGDGITDDRDGCPKDAEDEDGFQDEDGCPDLDNDGDGLADAQDKCPLQAETVNGVDDGDGCPDMSFSKIEVTAKAILLKEAIHFSTGRADIMVDSYPILDEVVSALKANAAIRIRVEGHTDSQGSRESNLTLSQKRAQAVVDYLTGHGISANRMTAEGFGPDRPVAPNNTDRGMAANRRVEIHIVDR
jgi:outer membrane protein OmpA-like peptidoglycan-associated protein